MQTVLVVLYTILLWSSAIYQVRSIFYRPHKLLTLAALKPEADKDLPQCLLKLFLQTSNARDWTWILLQVITHLPSRSLLLSPLLLSDNSREQGIARAKLDWTLPFVLADKSLQLLPAASLQLCGTASRKRKSPHELRMVLQGEEGLLPPLKQFCEQKYTHGEGRVIPLIFLFLWSICAGKKNQWHHFPTDAWFSLKKTAWREGRNPFRFSLEAVPYSCYVEFFF